MLFRSSQNPLSVSEPSGYMYMEKGWEAAASHGEISSVLCDHLERWDREGGKETQEGGDGGDICIRIADSLAIQQKLTQHCKAIILQ